MKTVAAKSRIGRRNAPKLPPSPRERLPTRICYRPLPMWFNCLRGLDFLAASGIARRRREATSGTLGTWVGLPFDKRVLPQYHAVFGDRQSYGPARQRDPAGTRPIRHFAPRGRQIFVVASHEHGARTTGAYDLDHTLNIGFARTERHPGGSRFGSASLPVFAGQAVAEAASRRLGARRANPPVFHAKARDPFGAGERNENRGRRSVPRWIQPHHGNTTYARTDNPWGTLSCDARGTAAIPYREPAAMPTRAAATSVHRPVPMPSALEHRMTDRCRLRDPFEQPRRRSDPTPWQSLRSSTVHLRCETGIPHAPPAPSVPSS